LKDLFYSRYLICKSVGVSEAHASHSSHTTGHASSTTGRSTTSRLGDIADHGLSGDHERSNTGGINEGGSDDLGRVNDTSLHHVDVLAGGSVVSALQVSSLEEFVDDDGAFVSSVLADGLDGDLASLSHDIDTDTLVEVLSLDVVKSLRGEEEGGTTAGNDSFIGSSSGGAEGILNAVLELSDFDFGRSTDLNDGNSTGESTNTLLELLSVVVTGGLLHLVSESLNTLGDFSRFSSSSHDNDIVLRDDDLLGRSHDGNIGIGEALSEVLRDELGTSGDSDILHGVTSVVTESRGLDAANLESTTELVDNEGGESLRLNILSNDEEGLLGLHAALEEGEELLDGADLLVKEEKGSILEDTLLGLGVSDEVGGNESTVPLESLNVLNFSLKRFAFRDGDGSVSSESLENAGNESSNDGITVG